VAFSWLCGATHVMGYITVWNPIYVQDGLLKSVTAVVSVATALVMVPFIPAALAMRSPQELERVNARLSEEVEARRQSELALHQANATLSQANAALAAAERDVLQLNEQLEARVRERTAELEAANRDLEGFSYSVSHDLRAPLRAINNFSSFLAEDHAGQLDQEGLRLLDRIRSNSEKMSELINGLLAFARMGQLAPRRARVDLNVLVAGVLGGMRDAGQDTATIDVSARPVVTGDRAMLDRLLQNLL